MSRTRTFVILGLICSSLVHAAGKESPSTASTSPLTKARGLGGEKHACPANSSTRPIVAAEYAAETLATLRTVEQRRVEGRAEDARSDGVYVHAALSPFDGKSASQAGNGRLAGRVGGHFEEADERRQMKAILMSDRSRARACASKDWQARQVPVKSCR